MKHYLPSLLLIALLLCACGNGAAPETTAPQTTTAAPIADTRQYNLAEFTIVRSDNASPDVIQLAVQLKEALETATGVEIKLITDWEKYGQTTDHTAEREILLGETTRPESTAVLEEIDNTRYAIACVGEKLVLAGENVTTLTAAVEHFLNEYLKGHEKGVIELPNNLEYLSDKMKIVITSSIGQMRDPYILVDNGRLYAYGTGWVCYRNVSGKLNGMWTQIGKVVDEPIDVANNRWAPEVHKYNGAYYMFTTYLSAKTGHHGCTILRADSPEGPFVEITDGHITPHDWDSIDGTFYVDPDGQPWMVFVHEWTSTDDKIGRMVAAKLSEDLTHFISEPVELFRADDPSWSRNKVTDGCFLYRCADGQLLMIWSNWDQYGYCVGVARSRDGRVDGKWEQDETLLYSKSMSGKYDGGHGMLFTLDDQLWMALHSPNEQKAGRDETPIFIPLREENGSLVWDGVMPS